MVYKMKRITVSKTGHKDTRKHETGPEWLIGPNYPKKRIAVKKMSVLREWHILSARRYYECQVFP